MFEQKQECLPLPLLDINQNQELISAAWSQAQFSLTSNANYTILELESECYFLSTDRYLLELAPFLQECEVPWAWILEIWGGREQILSSCYWTDICCFERSCNLYFNQSVSFINVNAIQKSIWSHKRKLMIEQFLSGLSYTNMQMKTYRLDHGSLVWKLITLMRGICVVELRQVCFLIPQRLYTCLSPTFSWLWIQTSQIVSGKGRLAMSVLHLLIGAAVAYASPLRGLRMYMLAVVKETQPFGVLLSSECRPRP